MKTIGWTLLIVVFILLAMILVTIASQADLLQTRVQQGIGSSADTGTYFPEPYGE